MADGVWVQPELLRDGADFPMFGVEPVTDLYAQFTVEHAHLRKIRGNGSTKRPRRPQRTQRSKPWCRCRAPFPWACRFRIGSAHRSGILPAKESIREDTSVTRGDEWRRRYARWRSRWSWRPSGLCWCRRLARRGCFRRGWRSGEDTSEPQSPFYIVCPL